MGKHLVLVGGGHAHLTTLLKIHKFVKRGHRVTLISPSPHHYYSGMGPGLLAGTFTPAQTRFHIQRMAQERGADFLADRVTGVDPVHHRLHLESGADMDFDLVSFNIGSTVALPTELNSPRLVRVKPIENLYRARRDILARRGDRLRFVVAGGGAAGVEIAGNLWRLLSQERMDGDIVLIAGKQLLGDFPPRTRELARRSLEQRGIRTLEPEHVTAMQDGDVHLESGATLPCDLMFAAIGITPPTLFREAGLAVADDGALQVNAALQSTSDAHIFGGGDCISLQGQALPRVGVHAVRQNPILYHNLRAALEDNELRDYLPQKRYLLILNLGDDTGVAVRGPFTGNGTGALHLKNWIDRRFMHRFQVSGENEKASSST